VPRSTHDLLLELLRMAATGGGLRARGPRQRSGIEALEAEGLIELRSGVRRATAEGVKVLQDRGQAPRPSGALAVMFTDLEGSTRLMERFGEAAALALVRRHFALLRIAVAEHHGHEVKSLGDGLMVVFGGVPDAVACAAAMQEAVVREGAQVGLRIGIHAGEPVQEENDYFGMPVIIARRLCDAAAAGQTLVSEHVAQLVAEREFEALGGITLKGLSEPVTASALAQESPAVRPPLPATATAV
jgi:class 3 adenylate cyclase